MTDLAAHYRGDTFDYSVTLVSPWLFADFTGGIKFTLRSSLPASTVTDDTDAVDQAVSGTEITGSDDTFTIVIPAIRTTAWPTQTLYWDIQGKVTSTGYVYTIDAGKIRILSDITRAQ